MNWYIGQEIICIKSTTNGKIKNGQQFKIVGLSKTPCCGRVLINIGDDWQPNFCEIHQKGYDRNNFGYAEILFATLDVDISELTEILERKEHA